MNKADIMESSSNDNLSTGYLTGKINIKRKQYEWLAYRSVLTLATGFIVGMLLGI
jgi:hypothetical protein